MRILIKQDIKRESQCDGVCVREGEDKRTQSFEQIPVKKVIKFKKKSKKERENI